eukprot:5856548-Prymnesium_polylepis.1
MKELGTLIAGCDHWEKEKMVKLQRRWDFGTFRCWRRDGGRGGSACDGGGDACGAFRLPLPQRRPQPTATASAALKKDEGAGQGRLVQTRSMEFQEQLFQGCAQ